MNSVRAVPLTASNFAPFGDVIEEPAFDPTDPKPNRRFDDLVEIDPGPRGLPMVSLLRLRVPAVAPYRVFKLERHPLGSQAFIPTIPARLLVAVAHGGDTPSLDTLVVFVTDGRQGINYRRGVWHAPVTVLAPTTLLVIDRNGEGSNCEIVELAEPFPVEVD